MSRSLFTDLDNASRCAARVIEPLSAMAANAWTKFELQHCSVPPKNDIDYRLSRGRGGSL